MMDILNTSSDSGFGLDHLPYGAFIHPETQEQHLCTRLGNTIVDLTILEQKELIGSNSGLLLFQREFLNDFMAGGKSDWQLIRKQLQKLLGADTDLSNDIREHIFFSISMVDLVLPVQIGDYTDFYSSREHATNVGSLFRDPENALQPNWLHLPVGYHGRSSSIVPSGTDIMRPAGQILPSGSSTPLLSPTRALDFELEMGFFTGNANQQGFPVPIQQAEDHIFGIALVNDWSARDIQKWEYVPLGPFLAKNFATSLSYWITPLDALEPFRCDGPSQTDPEPLPYLKNNPKATFDIQLEVLLNNEKICTTNFKYLYWSMSQQLTHHTITGCNLRAGDLLASGTISGPKPYSHGCLLEMTKGGKNAFTLDDGESRIFLEDGDMVTLRGFAKNDTTMLELGEVCGVIIPGK